MDFCANIFNYSELVSTIVFHHKWNLTSSSSFMEHKILSDFDDNVSSIRNTAWMLANGKYVFSLAVVMAILLRFRLTLLKQQGQLQQQAFSFANFVSTVKLLHWNRCDYPGILFSLSCFIAFMILLPLLVVTWLCVLCYRQYIYFIIRVSEDNVNSNEFIFCMEIKIIVPFLCSYSTEEIWRALSWFFGRYGRRLGTRRRFCKKCNQCNGVG